MRFTGLAAGITALISGCSPEGDETKAKLAKVQEQVEEKRRELDHWGKVVQATQELESNQAWENSPRRFYDEDITPGWSAAHYACPECLGTGKVANVKCWNCKGTGFSPEPSPPRPIKARPLRAMER